LRGPIDQRFRLDPLPESDVRRVRFDLAGVSFVSLEGASRWVALLDHLSSRGARVVITRCSEAFVYKMNMIVAMHDGVDIESFFAPYECPACRREALVCIDVQKHCARLQEGQPPLTACPTCRQLMSFADLPARYFCFLMDATRGAGGGAAAAARKRPTTMPFPFA
jgi:hypothetical protein